jgi:hypothetical protein
VSPPIDTDTTLNPPTPVTTPVPPVATPTPVTTPTPTPPSAGTSTRKKKGKAPVARVSRVGKKVKVSGHVAGASTGSVSLVVQRRQKGKWKTVSRVSAHVSSDGSFSRTITAKAAGKHRVQARFKGTKTARASVSSFRSFTSS